MSTPNIRYYARLEYDKGSRKIPKYTIIAQAGYYPPMEELRGKDGRISMYLQEKLKEGANVPAMRLQAKNSLNFTGLKDYFVDGKLSGYAYGYPLSDRTYSAGEKPNPFFECKDDCFLFVVHPDKAAISEPEKIRPTFIELIVLEGAKVLAAAYCKQLIMGGFDEALKSLRGQVKR